MCEEEGVGFIYLLGNLVGKEDREMVSIYVERAQHYSMRTRFDLWTVEQVATSQGVTEKPNTGGTDKDSNNKSTKNILEKSTIFGYNCVYLNARSI